MNILFCFCSSGINFRTDRTQPRPLGKFIAGTAPSLDKAIDRIAAYLGEVEFTMEEVPFLPNVKDEPRLWLA